MPLVRKQTCITTKGKKNDDQRESEEGRKLKKEEVNDNTKKKGFSGRDMGGSVLQVHTDMRRLDSETHGRGNRGIK